ncbi:MAG: L-rhamnose mutarotase [Solirubrobacteraceae bacterium]|jgi:L-rhamnose mutarotase
MQRICFTLQVRTDAVAEYRARHAAVWPEMREALRDTGWRNYSLFLRDDGLLIGYVECENFDASVAAMQEREVNERWQAEMAPLFALAEGATPDRAMAPLPEIFHLP